jgi:carboxyl-terminal processing protease
MTDGEGVRDANFDKNLVQRGVSFALVAAVAFMAGIVVEARGAPGSLSSVPFLGDGLTAAPDQSANLADFWKAWNALNDHYVVTHASSTIPENKDKIWGAIEGLAASYGDPYTVFFPPEEAKVFQDDISGNFEGVGMEMGIDKQGILAVIAPIKGTPADRAGLKPGDEILSVDGKTTDGLSTDEAVKLIRGPRGTTVTFAIYRDGETLTVPVVRDVINVPNIDSGLDASTGVFHIALYEFTAQSAGQFDDAFERFKKSGSKRLVIDLRGNPGGYLDAAVHIASHFLPEGTMVVTEDYEGKAENDVLRSSGIMDVPAGTKVAVLIDKGSASASEILAGALQDNKAATVIGAQSFGKGSVQQLIDIDGGSLKVTVARWLTPAGHAIMGEGITPDVKVERTQDDARAGRDPQMERAAELLAAGS